MAKTLALVFGVVFILVGLLGWVPNPIVGPDGIFRTDMTHDLVHLAVGAVLLLVALMSPASSAAALKVFGVVYLLVAVLGFVVAPDGGPLLGTFVDTNTSDHLLHVVLGVVLLAAGFLAGKNGNVPQQPSSMNV